MGGKTNEEKLRILQERLAQIKQKQDDVRVVAEEKEEVMTPPEFHENKKDKNSSFRWLKYLTIIIGLVYGTYYIYNNSTMFEMKPIIETNEKSKKEIEDKFVLKYKKRKGGDNIAIVKSFEDQSSAKALVNDLKVKGFKANYFFLPEESNSIEEVYQVFIGPYENEEETRQWIENINQEVIMIKLSTGSVIGKIKNKKLQLEEKLAKEKAEKERLAKEKAEKEKLAKEKAEKEKIAKEKVEKEKLTKEKIEKEKVEKERLAKEENKKNRLDLIQEELKNEKERLNRDRKQLEEDRKNLLRKKKKEKSKIKISYTYDFTPTIKDEGVLIINNNAGYPKIKQKFANIKAQGGIEKIIKEVTYEIDTYGILIEGIYFEKSGTTVSIYKGSIKEVNQ